MRCSGARVLRTPSHVKERRTAAIVVRSLWAALGEVCVAGLVVGWVVVRLTVCWPVVGSVVVAVDIGTCDLLEGWMEDSAAMTAGRLVATQAGKSLWLVTLFERLEARSATEATVEASDTLSRNQGAKIPDERRASIGQSYGAARCTPYVDRRREE